MIAHVTATFPPYWAGTGNVAYHNARLLQERGYEVAVFTAGAAQAAPIVPAAMPFAVHRLPAWFRLGNAPLTPDLVHQLRGCRLIHLHYPYIFGAELALVAARRYRIPLVLTYHNRLLEARGPKRLLFGLYNALLEPLLLRGATQLLAVRAEHFSSLHPHTPLRVLELSNGVDTTVFRPHDRLQARAALGLSADAPVALFVGALDQAHRFKNVDGLLAAFAASPLQDAQLVVVGDGDLRPALQRLAAELGVAARVYFLGSRTPAELPSVYSAADVTVLPSTGVESFGLVLLESLACATPVIATNLPGVRTLVADPKDGLLVSPHDKAALTDALTDLLRDPERTRAMGVRGREKVVANFDWQVIGDRLETLYHEVLT